jgi:hypothetical protein
MHIIPKIFIGLIFFLCFFLFPPNSFLLFFILILRYATPILKDPGLIIKIAENGLKAIGIIAGAEIVNQVSDSAQDDDTSDIPKIDDVSEVAGTGAPMPDGEPPEDWNDKNYIFIFKILEVVPPFPLFSTMFSSIS